MIYHILTLKKYSKCLMFNTILPDNVPRASFIYARRLQLRMNINEHLLIRDTTLFCLKQCIYMNQLYELSASMCSVACLLRLITPIHWRLTSSTGKWNFALLNDACHIFEAYVFTMTLAFFLDSRPSALMLFYWKTYGIFLI